MRRWPRARLVCAAARPSPATLLLRLPLTLSPGALPHPPPPALAFPQFVQRLRCPLRQLGVAWSMSVSTKIVKVSS
jgi:hypothetical protein